MMTVDSGEKHAGHLVFVDVLNVISCFAVVALHTSLDVFSVAPTFNWLKSFAVQSLSIFAVPVFFMISGMNLLSYRARYSTAVFFRKRAWKVGRALLLGSLVCYLAYCLWPHSFYGAERFIGLFDVKDFVKLFLTNGINDTYWFFYFIIALYVATPLLTRVTPHRGTTEYLLSGSLLVSVAIPFVQHLGINGRYFTTLFNWPMFSGIAMFYFVAGYYLHSRRQELNRLGPVWLLVFVVATIAMFWAGLSDNEFGHGRPAPGDPSAGLRYDRFFVDIMSPMCVVQSVALFLFLQSMENGLRAIPARGRCALSVLSGGTLGVYLFHMLVINWNWTSASTAMLRHMPLVKAFVIYVATVAIVIACKTLIHTIWFRARRGGRE